MSIMAIHATHSTWMNGLNFSISWWSRVGIALLLLRRRCKRLIHVWLVLLWEIIPSLVVSSSFISLFVVGGMIISFSSSLFLWIRLGHVYANLVGWLGGNFDYGAGG